MTTTPAKTASFPVTGPIRATLRFGVGEVSVTSSEDQTVTATVDPADPRSTRGLALAESAAITLRGDELLLEVPERRLNWGSVEGVRIELSLPPGSTVTTQAGVVTFTADEGLADVSLKTGVGKVRLGDVSGTVRVAGGSVDVELGTASRVELKVGRGGLQLGSAAEVHVKSAMGKVDVLRSEGRMRVEGAMVSLTVGEASRGEIEFETSMGSSTIGVVEGTAVELDLTSTTGDASCEFAMSESAETGEAALQLRLRTHKGDLVVRRSTPPAAAAS